MDNNEKQFGNDFPQSDPANSSQSQDGQSLEQPAQGENIISYTSDNNPGSANSSVQANQPISSNTTDSVQNTKQPKFNNNLVILVVVIIALLGAWWYFGQDVADQDQSLGDDTTVVVNDTPEEGSVVIVDEKDDEINNENGSETGIGDDGATENLTTIVAYYNNIQKDPGLTDCSRVYPLERKVEKKYESDVVNTVRGMLFDLTAKQKTDGWVSAIPTGTMLKEVKISDGVARANFTAPLNSAAGSCNVIAIRSQIEQTLLRFPYISSVEICIEGNCNQDEILQP